jgi:hypothetical protein
MSSVKLQASHGGAAADHAKVIGVGNVTEEQKQAALAAANQVHSQVKVDKASARAIGKNAVAVVTADVVILGAPDPNAAPPTAEEIAAAEAALKDFWD